jgi:hypothetical protein
MLEDDDGDAVFEVQDQGIGSMETLRVLDRVVVLGPGGDTCSIAGMQYDMPSSHAVPCRGHAVQPYAHAYELSPCELHVTCIPPE